MLFYRFKILIIFGLICQLIGVILLIYDIRPTLRQKKTIDEAFNRNYKSNIDSENILANIVDILKHRKKVIWLETETNKILKLDDREKEHAIRFKLGLIFIIIGFLLQIFSLCFDY